jgi:hypothetical protein
MINAYKILVGKRKGKRSLRRQRCGWEDIKTDLKEIRCNEVDCTLLAKDSKQCRALVKAVINFRVLRKAGNFLNSCVCDGFSRRTLLHGFIW